MSQWGELTDFSMYGGRIPCILCKGESQLTLVGDHWKCTACAHIFNKDGSPIGVDCYCDACRSKETLEVPMSKDLDKKIGKSKKKK